MRNAPITRRGFALAGACAALLGAPALRAQARPERTRVTIAVGGKGAFYYLPLTIAEQLGYFKAEGVDVEITDHVGGPRALQALTTGGADVVNGAYEHTIQLQSRNQFIQSFVLMGRAPQIAVGVSTKAVPHYKAPDDLRGRKIGVSAPGSSTNMVANMVLTRAGVRANEVSYVGVGTSMGALSALRSGQIDAMSNTDPVMTMLEQRGEVKIISDTRTLKGTQDVFGGPMPAACFYAANEFVQKNPNTCQAMANAVVHALKWLQTAGPSDIIKTVPDAYLLGDRALYLASFSKVREAISLDGMLPDEGPRTALRAMASFESGIRPEKIDLARTYTNDFARRAKEKFKT
ncbi:ABC transporter substrate-binding protein [Ramlibacter sp. Leaf400]|uniref:ABC transporter substrate-binding protein n=1 Tax=Ramlibacter sp. Leaf400 TaxID=1736365 RepID=UPI0006F9A420|nr:ABC transporter substrate-binding protein [Ramlibacter sp. Leaf400]KQT07693.1 ABC transporter substrate-binding protein [Ramlibacter sp. Leaf400]